MSISPPAIGISMPPIISTWLVAGAVIGWQVAWWAAVLGAAQGWFWLGPAITIPVAFALILASPPRPDRWVKALHLSVISLVIGIMGDTLLGLTDAARFAGGILDGIISPPWMWGLWILLALALLGPLAWLTRWPRFALVLGLVCGPVAYGGGIRLGAMSAPSGALTLICASAVLYAIALPLLISAARLEPSDA